MARLKNVTFVKRLGKLLRGKCLRCGQAGHLYRDCRNEPVAATTPGPHELPVYLRTTGLARLWSLIL